MIFNKKIIEKFIDIKDISLEKIIETLTSFGFSTEILKDYRNLNKGIVVAKVLSKVKDLNYENINVCKVTDGTKEYTIICGAKNFNENDLVVLSKVGAILNNDFKIGKRKFGNYISEGMLCSYKELGIPLKDDEDGIVILNKNAKLGDLNPLKYFEFDDVLLEVEPLPSYPISKTIFGLIKLLSGKFNLNIKKTETNNYIKESFIIDSVNNENQAIQAFYFENNFKNKKINWLDNFSTIIGVQNENIIDKLINFINIFYDVNLKKIYLKNKPEKFSLNDIKNLKQDEKLLEKDKNFVLIVLENVLNKNNYPTSKILNIAIKHLINIISNEYKDLKIFADLEKIKFKKNEVFEIKISEIESLIGKKFKINEIKDILTPFEFFVEKINEETVKITCPTWNEYKNKAYVIEAIFRFYECKNVEIKKINLIPELNFKNKIFKYKNKIENYLLNIGINQVKTFSLVEKDDFILSLPLILEEDRKSKLLRTNLILSLIKLDLNKNIFTIDKVFLKENNEIKEKIKIAILLNKDLYFDVISKSQVKNNKFYLIQILKNIFDLLNISKSNLWKDYSKDKQLFLDKKVENTTFSKKGYEKIYWGNQFLGIIGETNIKKGSIFKHLFYLEIDFDLLIEFISKSKDIKFINRIDENLIYRDYSILFEEKFEAKISIKLKTDEIIEINHYNHWINLIKSLDSRIKNVDLIDIYKNKTLTFRVWIKNESIKDEIFENINNKINSFKNIKIKK